MSESEEMMRVNPRIQIMGGCAGMLIGAAVCEKIAENFADPRIALVIGLGVGFVVGLLLTTLFVKRKESRAE